MKLPRLKGIPKNVVVLGVVSFLTDVSSDMIYPLLPVFLTTTLGAGQWFIGLVEGIAESTAAFVTLASGLLTDRMRNRSRLVLAGYSLSSLVRPLVAVASAPWMVLAVRFFDRVGKGVRTAPRDALIADSVEVGHRGKAYGLHRSLDHAGAVCGPIIAGLLLAGWVTNMRILFALAAIPGLMAVVLVIWKVRDVREPSAAREPMNVSLHLPKDRRLRAYLAIYFLFVLSTSSDAFLLLRCRELGVPVALLPILWMMFNAVKATTTLPFGVMSDHFGRRRVILAGWLVYASIYAMFGMASRVEHAWTLFALYGLFYGLTEGSERAILADYAGNQERGRTFGWYYFLIGLGALPASLLFGAIWQTFGARAAFFTSAAISAAAALLLAAFMLACPAKPRHDTI